MGYKYKPNKAIVKRFRATKTGKLKAPRQYRSHLMSARSPKRKRQLRRLMVLFEGHARNMRLMMGIAGKKPARVAHQRALAAKAKAATAKA